MTNLGYREEVVKPAPIRVSDLRDGTAQWMGDTYRRLGGRLDTPPLRPGSWDLAFEGELLVELDEELHFNRYRHLTLEPEWAANLPWRSKYSAYSVDREVDCLSAGKWGQRWTTSSSESLFGTADTPGTFLTSGAPRWKQRALYDAMKDALAAVGVVRLARLSIYDAVNGVLLGAALNLKARVDLEGLHHLIIDRVAPGL
ncbi:DUF7255 family protein [Parafrigoribacterium mesophilum]|uniref:DUF7255 family protein n=1 Tax=Parafrigoribacterium mesophilum TaxID=433646 RepID=UPI0031FBADC7